MFGWLNVQDELIGQLSAGDKLWLFSLVPMSVVKSASCRSSLIQQLTDECCGVIERCSDSAATFTLTVAELVQLVCVLIMVVRKNY